MGTFIFIENISLIVLYSITVILCEQSFRRHKEIFMKYLIGMYIFYILDVFIIFDAEFYIYTLSGNRIITSLITYSAFKIFVAVGIIVFYLMIYWTLMRRKINWYHMLPALIILTVSILCILGEETHFTVWLFYSVRQFTGLALVFYYFYTLNKTKDIEYHKHLQNYRKLFLMILIMLMLIFLEDTIVIFNLNYFISNIPWFNEKNMSEDLLSVCFVVLTLRYINHLNNDIVIQGEFKNIQVQNVENNSLSKGEMERTFSEKYNLTNRESEILHLLLEDKTNEEISKDLYITVGTVKAHVHKIFEKTEVNRRSQLLHKFQNENFVYCKE